MASYNPGTYEGTGRGYGGKLIVNVTVSENRIESVKVTQHKEYRGIAWGLNTTPMERFPKLIVEYQSLNIPTVDGADLTCAAILDATAAALKAAGASKEDAWRYAERLGDVDYQEPKDIANTILGLSLKCFGYSLMCQGSPQRFGTTKAGEDVLPGSTVFHNPLAEEPRVYDDLAGEPLVDADDLLSQSQCRAPIRGPGFSFAKNAKIAKCI